jgi:omega-6 fatty acid desaturase (delta-12 desaturase)
MPVANPNYNEDNLPTFTPMSWSQKEIRAAIPPQLFVRDTLRGLRYLARDLILAAACWYAATYIDPYFKGEEVRQLLTPVGAETARWGAWCL